MPLDFPNSPSIGATYSPAGVSKSWIYTGEQWSAITAPIEEGASVTVSDTPPSGASAGDLWFDSSSGVTSVYYDSSWIDVGGGGGGITDVTGTAPITVTGTDVKNVSVNVASFTATLDDYFVASSGGGGSFNAPVGYVGYYAATSAPAGWMECNGVTLEVADGPSYTNLRNFLIGNGSPFGNVDGDPRIPDLRGRFIRSFGTDSIVSSGTFGVKQSDAFRDHKHVGPGSYVWNIAGGSYPGNNVGSPNADTGYTKTGSLSSSSIGPETRPANLALLACIKL